MQTLLVIAGLLVAWYFASCALHPYTDCSSCGRSGESRSTGFNAFGACRRCAGTGRRRRLGARLLGRK